MEQRLEIKPGAADQDRQAAGRTRRRDLGERKPRQRPAEQLSAASMTP